MYSSIYVGNVRHHRSEPIENRFTYSLYLLLLDLDELDSVFRHNWFWSTGRFNFAWFRQQDHLRSLRKSDQSTLKDSLLEFLSDKGFGGVRRVRLLTQVRYLGFVMNPVSFFYCYDEQDRLQVIVAQVNNTPWGEEHLYVIDAREQGKTISVNALPKDFHVSPFMPMEMLYDMRYTTPGEKLAVRMTNFQAGTQMLDVVMSMARKKWTPMNLNRMLITYPLMSFKVFAAIYWQAIKLYFKKVPFFPHPRKKPSNSNSIKKTHTPQQNVN